MRTQQIVISFISAGLFLLLALRAFGAWNQRREARSAHLAVATGLYAASQIISATSQAIYNSFDCANIAPRWISFIQTPLTFAAFFFFVLFLFDFVQAPGVIKVFTGLGTVFFIVLVFIEKARFCLTRPNDFTSLVRDGTPFAFNTYLYLLIGWLCVITGLLWITFAIYGFKSRGLARFRMLSISAGFLLLFLLIGLLSLIAVQSGQSVQSTINVIRYIALATPPLLLVGFAPPAALTRKFLETNGSSGAAAAS